MLQKTSTKSEKVRLKMTVLIPEKNVNTHAEQSGNYRAWKSQRNAVDCTVRVDNGHLSGDLVWPDARKSQKMPPNPERTLQCQWLRNWILCISEAEISLSKTEEHNSSS